MPVSVAPSGDLFMLMPQQLRSRRTWWIHACGFLRKKSRTVKCIQINGSSSRCRYHYRRIWARKKKTFLRNFLVIIPGITRLPIIIQFHNIASRIRKRFTFNHCGIPPQEDLVGKATERIFSPQSRWHSFRNNWYGTANWRCISQLTIVRSIRVSDRRKGYKCDVGAGQMMFNKMLVVVDETDIHNYKPLPGNFRSCGSSAGYYFFAGTHGRARPLVQQVCIWRKDVRGRNCEVWRRRTN